MRSAKELDMRITCWPTSWLPAGGLDCLGDRCYLRTLQNCDWSHLHGAFAGFAPAAAVSRPLRSLPALPSYDPSEPSEVCIARAGPLGGPLVGVVVGSTPRALQTDAGDPE